MSDLPVNGALARHWDGAYAHGDTTRSWYQTSPEQTLRMLDRAGVSPSASLLDVGGGASTVVDALLARGFADLTVLDVSPAGLRTARRRLGGDAGRVTWLTGDVRSWQPERRWQVWHDRALLHFLTVPADQQRYLRALDAGTGPGTVLIVATFAPDGPDHCSGLPVTRHDPDTLTALLGAAWQFTDHDREQHHTPAGGVQPFTWATFRREQARRPRAAQHATFDTKVIAANAPRALRTVGVTRRPADRRGSSRACV